MFTPIRQFDRKYRLTVGDAKTREALVFTNHQMSFDIYKTSDNTEGKNSASIEIYNIFPEDIKKLQTDYPVAIFEIGYNSEKNLKRVFVGQIVTISTRKRGEDRITQFILGTGYTDLNHELISQHTPAGTTVKQVIDELTSKFPNISRVAYNGTNLNSKLINGYSLSGTLKSVLDEICNSNKLEWRLDDDVLYVNDKDKADTNDLGSAFVISPTSGLIEIPYYTSPNPRRTLDDSAKQQGVQFTMLPNPSILAGSLIKLEDTEIVGWYKVDATRFSGSWRGDSWIQEVKCSAIEKIIKDGVT